jgi:excisionase family DNA binding protein
MSDLLTVSEAAAACGLNRETIARRLRDGSLRGINLAPEGAGRPSWRISKLDLAAWVESNRSAAR